MKKKLTQKCKIEMLVLLSFFLAGTSFSQIKVSGKVSDESGSGLPGVTVLVLNTSNGTVTDIDGKYALEVENSNVSIIFSFIGLETQQVQLNNKTDLDVIMLDDIQTLSEVIVVGYSSQKKSTLTGAVAPVSMADMQTRRVGGVLQALQGQVAGVQITQSTGAPGDGIQVRIRGEGTIGNNDPLYVIDGIPSRDISFLSPSDIESISVLKDASAAAIYGSRASAGVIVITTKNGSSGKSKIELNYFKGIQSVINLPTMLNSEQYMDVVEQAWNNAGYLGTNPYTADKDRNDFADTNWLDELFEFGHSENLQLSASGASDKLQYLVSANYFGQNGIVVYDNDKYQRMNFRTNLNADVTDRLKIGTNIQLSVSAQDKLSSKGDAPGIIRHAMLRPPIISIYKDVNDPTYSTKDPFTDLPFYKHNDRDNGGWESDKYEWSSNPIALAHFTDDKRKVYKTFSNFYSEYSFLKEKQLKLRSNIGIDLNLFHNKTFNTNFGDDDGGGNSVDAGLGRQNRPNSLNEDRGEEFTFTWNNTLSYNKAIQRHEISALIGTEFIDNHSSSLGATRSRFEYDNSTFRYIDFGSTEMNLWNGGSGSEWSLFSVFGSANYIYSTKYMLTANIRADASSRFSENNRWGYFPSLSAGWRISEENFLKSVNWVSDLKLRASLGTLGNQEIDNYAYLTLIRKDGDRYVTSRYGNPDLKWETTKQYNYGLDLGILNNKFYLSADYFIKNTSDILLPISLPGIAGDVLPTIVNAGEVSNKGFELAASFRNSERKFKYNINANMATITNTVKKLHPNLPSLIGQVSRTEVGQSLNAYYGYEMEGIYQNDAEISEHLYETINPAVNPGDIKFKDLNNDGMINDKDRTFIGSPAPDLTYGLNFSGQYGGFDIAILFQGVKGVDRYNDSKKIVDYDTRPFNYTTRVLDAWNGEGSSNTIPRVSFTDNGSSKVSSVFVEDASYFRLKNIEIGYSFRSLFKKSGIIVQDVRLYVSAQNVFTVTDYTGLDPESTDLIDYGTFPQARSLIFGVNVKL